jgi:DNA helicase-2/ATP-dependent DNA helicase PcrA
MIGDQAQMFSSEDPTRPQPNLTKGLNEPQAEAVAHGDGPILVLAGAGSGKTRVLTHRVAQLILEQGVPSSRILAVTFTNKAAQEMRERLHSLLGTDGENLWITTFHSAGLRILRHNASRLSYTNQFVIYDDQDTKGVLKQVLKDLNINEDRYPLDTFSRAIDKFKNNYILPAEAGERASSVETDLQAQVYDRYQKVLLEANVMDFGDLLVNAVRVLREFPEVLDYYRRTLHYILVDEFQDTNKVQYMFIRLLAEPRRNLFVVGDDDQSIYGFRGATISNILEFEKDFPKTKVVKLEQNYRSTGTILNAAHAVIEKNKSRKAKKLWTAGADGDQIRTFIGYDENQEAEFITSEIRKLSTQGYKYSEMAILYRTNAQTRALEESLVRGKIPYKIFGGLKFFDRKEVKDILAYVRLLINPADNQAFQRVVNTPPRGIGAQAVQAIADEARETSMPFLHASVTVAQSNKHVKKFVELMGELKHASQTMKLGAFLGFIVEKTEYGPRLAAMKDPTAQSRIENLQELESLGRTMERPETSTEDVMKDFLDRISLTSSADVPAGEAGANDPNQKTDTVSLMTLHLAKGLEFPVVFLAGLEEGLLPHYRSLDDVVGLEEERRLCYVGITRAMKVLYLSRAHNRGMFAAGGSAGSAGGARVVSRFAKDIDPKSLCAVGTERSQGATFIDGYPRFSFDDEDDIDTRIEDDYSNTWRRKKKYPSRNDAEPVYSSKSNVSLDQIRNLLMPADAMKQESKVPDEYHGKPSAAIEQLAPGVEVIHPSFGKGCVESVKGSGNTANVTVKFDSFDEPKKLVYRFAKLVLG